MASTKYGLLVLSWLALTACVACGSRSRIFIVNSDFSGPTVNYVSAAPDVLEKYRVGDVRVIPEFEMPGKDERFYRLAAAVVSTRVPPSASIDSVRLILDGKEVDCGEVSVATSIPSLRFIDLRNSELMGDVPGEPIAELVEAELHKRLKAPDLATAIIGGEYTERDAANPFELVVEIEVSATDATGAVLRKTIRSSFELLKIKYSLIPMG